MRPRVQDTVPLVMYIRGDRYEVGEADVTSDPAVAVLFHGAEYAAGIARMIDAEVGKRILFELPGGVGLSREIELTPCGSNKLENWIRTY